MHTVSVEVAMPIEWSAAATLVGAGSLVADATVIPASKHPSGIREFADWAAKQVAVRETVDVINHLLSDAWNWLMHSGIVHRLSGLPAWAMAVISGLLAWASGAIAVLHGWWDSAISVLHAWWDSAISWLRALFFDN